MKTANLRSIIEIYNKSDDNKLSHSYMKYLGTDVKDIDLQSLKSLLHTLHELDKSLYIKDLNGFYMGYKIPQIGKEFDLLRLTDSTILNIEYKSQTTQKVHKQLLQNQYYLKFLGLPIYSFSYIENENKLYKLDDQNSLIEASFDELIYIIKSQWVLMGHLKKDFSAVFRLCV